MSEPSYAAVLGRIPSGIYILTVRHDGQETGMLASWVMQAGFEPPMVSVAVNRQRYITEWLDAGASFVLNVVGESQGHLLKHFGHGFPPEASAFEGLAVERSPLGVPVLSDATGYLECVPTGSIASGDHQVYLARIESGTLLRDERPMVHVRKTGARY